MGRSETLFRKAEAIKGLCGARVALIVFDCDGRAVKHWPKEPEAVRATIEAYRMFVAKGKKRIRDTVDPDPPRPSEGDFSFLDTAVAQKLQAIDSKIQTMSTMMSSSSIINSSSSSDWFVLAEQSCLDFMDYAANLDDLPPFESYLAAAPPPPEESPADPPSFGVGGTTATTSSSSSSTTDWFVEAAHSGLDFMDYADLPSFASRPPPRESPATTSSSSGPGWIAAAATHASESEIIVLDDDSDDEDLCDPPIMETIVRPSISPLLIFGDTDDVYVHVEEGEDIHVDFEEREDVHVHVKEGEEGVHLDSSIFWTNLEDGFSSPGTYADFDLMTTSDYNLDF